MLTHRHEQAHLLRNVVHDLRTPLGNIEICAYLLDRKLTHADDEVREYIQAIHRQVAAAERILQDATAEEQALRRQAAETASFSLTNAATAGVT